MSALRRWSACGLALVAGLAPGCAEELGPVRRETTRVAGVMTVGHAPVVRGWVEFLPADGTVGDLRSAPLGPDGSFEVDGVAVGLNRVGIDGALAGTPPEFRRLFDPLGTPIRRQIPRSGGGLLKIDLIDEYARWVADRPAGG